MERFIKSKVVILSGAVLVLTIISVTLLVIVKQQQPKTSQVLVSKPSSVSTEQTLRKIIKNSFNNADQKGILAYFDLALAEKSPQQSYLYLQKAFNKMAASYQSLKSPEKKLALSKLRAYVSTLPNYKEADFVIPR